MLINGRPVRDTIDTRHMDALLKRYDTVGTEGLRIDMSIESKIERYAKK